MRIGIIGGGIIGTFTAWFLSKEGYEVTIFDKGSMRGGTSYGNAGMIVPSHMIPLASPGVVSKGLKWLLSSTSPLYIKPTLDLASLNWLLSFFNHANERNVKQNAPALIELSQMSRNLYFQLEESSEIDFSLDKRGIVMLFQSEETGKEESELVDLANQFGIPAKMLSGEGVSTLDPGTKYSVKGGIHFPQDATLNPGKLMNQLQMKLKEKGVQFISNSNIKGIKYDKQIKLHLDSEIYELDQMVVTAGVWSREFIKSFFKLNIPLMPGKGYSFDIPNNAGLKLASLLLDHRVSVTPLGDSIRFGGTMELSKINNKVRMNRVRGIVESIPSYYPEIKVSMPEKTDVWMGFRPCSTDGMPIIGELPGYPNVYIATGHGMLGVSLAPATAKMISDLVRGKSAEIDMNPFKFDR